MQLHLSLSLVGALLLGGVAAAEPAAENDVPTASRELTEVYFDYDSSAIRDDAAQKLTAAAKKLKCTCSSKSIFLGGFADPRGTAPYNVGLSIRRAEAVRDFLTMQGVPQERIILGIYGEDAPRRESFDLDRRVSIGLTSDPLHEVVDETLAEATAIVWSEPVTQAYLEGPRPSAVATRE